MEPPSTQLEGGAIADKCSTRVGANAKIWLQIFEYLHTWKILEMYIP